MGDVKKAVIIIIVFWAGFYAGKWDAKYGYEAGKNAGQNIRNLFNPAPSGFGEKEKE